jgi:2-methylcitrate dehydratase PrpD
VSIATDLWERFGRLDAAALPDDVSMVARQCMLDWFACAVAGSAEPVAAILRDELLDSDGPSSVIGTGSRTRPMTAALLNGAAGHALDYDDTHSLMSGHPTVPVLPAALALAEDLDCSGAELLAAFVAGVEVECRIAGGMGPSHYAKGWHVTSTMGVFGAAAAACQLLGLDAEQFGRAMGFAASQASGLKANFGTMTKPFHAGQAAERGLLAARLAQRGFTANPDAVTANQGLAQAAGDGSWRDRQYDGWLLPRTLFKYHAACYLTHAAIEATSRAIDGDDEDIQQVTLVVHPSLLDVCAIPRPRTGLEAKFSLAATTAFTIVGIDTADPASFTDENATDARVQSLVERVAVATDPQLRATQVRAEVHAVSGTRTTEYDTGVPARDLVDQGRKLRAKFAALAEPVLGAEAAALAGRIEEVAQLPSARQLVG